MFELSLIIALVAGVAFIALAMSTVYAFKKSDSEDDVKPLSLTEEEVVEPTENKATVSPASLNKMTKKQLDEYAESIGIKLDRRKKKADMIADLNDQLDK